MRTHSRYPLRPPLTLACFDALSYRFPSPPFLSHLSHSRPSPYRYKVPTLDTSAHVPSLLPVGSICVISDKPRASGDDFTSADRDFLHMCSDMIAREFHLGYQEKRRELETTQNTFLGRFLEKVLVRPLDDKAEGVEKASQSAAAPSTTAVRDEQLSKEEQKAQEEVSVVASSIQLAATQFLALTGATSAAILDLR